MTARFPHFSPRLGKSTSPPRRRKRDRSGAPPELEFRKRWASPQGGFGEGGQDHCRCGLLRSSLRNEHSSECRAVVFGDVRHLSCGRWQGHTAAASKMKVPDLRSKSVQQRSDDHLYAATAEGEHHKSYLSVLQLTTSYLSAEFVNKHIVCQLMVLWLSSPLDDIPKDDVAYSNSRREDHRQRKVECDDCCHSVLLT